MMKKFTLSKRKYICAVLAMAAVLGVLRRVFPVANHDGAVVAVVSAAADGDSIMHTAALNDARLRAPHCLHADLGLNPGKTPHRLLSVSSYDKVFPDLQDTHMATALRLGVQPMQNRAEAARDSSTQLVYVGMNPYYFVKPLSNSIPYLVPRAQLLLSRIGRNFIDSLMVKRIKPSLITVTSLTRTRDDIARLQRHNYNASDNSCHCYGTTFDISYTKYHAICEPGATPSRQTRDDTLRWVLSEVLRDQREAGLCYVKYERKQGCYHITAR